MVLTELSDELIHIIITFAFKFPLIHKLTEKYQPNLLYETKKRMNTPMEMVNLKFINILMNYARHQQEMDSEEETDDLEDTENKCTCGRFL